MYYNVIHSIIDRGSLVMGITSIRLLPEVEEPLELLSKKLDRSRNYLINQAIKEFIENKALEDKRWSETLTALESVKNGQVIEEQEVMDWLKSWGSNNEKTPPKL